MEKIKIYHNPRCSKSREALAILREKGIEPEIIEYLKTKPSFKEIKDLLVRLHLKPLDIIRQGEEIFKKKLKNKNFSEEEWITIITENPQLIERPIIVKGSKAIICRPPERVEEFFEKKR